jgi:hypothetical protein
VAVPVGYDRDGAVANLYDVAVCPTVTFAYPGGTALRTTLGLLDTPKLDATLRELVAGSERRRLEAAAVTEPTLGWVDLEVADEFPELRLIEMPVDARPGRSPESVRDHLRYLSNRYRGAQAVAQRQAAVPSAYRVFYRHVGLDPDADRTPAEAAMVDRLMHGGFKSENLVDDALLIALVETGVPIWALDATRVDGSARGTGRASG